MESIQATSEPAMMTLSDWARHMGRRKSERKAEAARQNGKLGGRPRKAAPDTSGERSEQAEAESRAATG